MRGAGPRLLSLSLSVFAAGGLAGTLIGGALAQVEAVGSAPTTRSLFELASELSPETGDPAGGTWDGPVSTWDRIGKGPAPRLPERLLGPAGFANPLRAWYEITDRFGVPRGEGHVHGGIDLGLPNGAAEVVYAACAGEVVTATTSETYGSYVVVDCGEGWTTVYAHLSASAVTVGQRVTHETALGRSGSTGYSTGEHLHFEVRWKGTPYDPEQYIEF